MIVDWFKRAPTPVVVAIVITCGVVALGVLGVFVVLSINGVDTLEFRQWIQTVGQILIYPILGVGTLASVSAARSSAKAEEQTNGHLSDREDTIAALTAQNRQQEIMIRQLQARR